MAWDREVILTAGTGGTGLEISNLDISFDIQRSCSIENNTAKFIVYNAKLETRTKILSKGNNIVLKAGYKDEGGAVPIFIGTIYDSRDIYDNLNWMTEIDAIDFGNNKNPIKWNEVNWSYKENSLLSGIIQDLAVLLGVPVTGLENANIKLNNTFNYTGGITNLMKKIDNTLKINNVGIYFDNSEIVIYKTNNQESRFGVVKITAKNGLIGSPEKRTNESSSNTNDPSDYLELISLLNPKIKPRTIINLESLSFKGFYSVNKLNHVGDNFGGEFITKLECEI